MTPIQLAALRVAVLVGLLLLALATGAYGGWKVANDHRDALELKLRQGKDEALAAAAEAIADIDVQNVTVNRTLETKVKEHVVYADCQNAPDVVDTLNRALSGAAP